jgi:protein tyrosine/serine phosphatase
MQSSASARVGLAGAGTAVAGLLCGCVYLSSHTLHGACDDSLESTIRNYCVVVPGALWRGERPTAADATWLMEHEVGSVVSLQLGDERAFEAATPRGPDHAASYYHVSDFDPVQMLSRTRLDHHVAHFLAILRTAPKPVYVHCRAGVDRVGVLIAAYRILVEGASREQAIAELRRFHSPWIQLEVRYVRSISDDRKTEILRQVAQWEPLAGPSARIDCRRGRCSFERG